ncbi:response regulator transcription factor [Paenibacillus marinisediminis]
MAKILVAEDEAILRMLITDTLEDEGYLVTTASDGEEALRMIEANDYDLAVLDHMMPKMTGLEVISAVRASAEHNQLKMMMLSAKSQQSDREHALANGADEFMSKPFSPIELVRKVGVMLNG